MSCYEWAAIGSVGGIDIVETPSLPWHAIHFFPGARKVICGETQQFLHVLAIAQIRADMRADLERQLDAFAKRVGVDRSTVSE